jgi:hypothetical protein
VRVRTITSTHFGIVAEGGIAGSVIITPPRGSKAEAKFLLAGVLLAEIAIFSDLVATTRHLMTYGPVGFAVARVVGSLVLTGCVETLIYALSESVAR